MVMKFIEKLYVLINYNQIVNCKEIEKYEINIDMIFVDDIFYLI